MKSIITEITINAPIATVWQQLTNFDNYTQWNPFIHIKGEAKVGARLENTIYLEGQKPQVFRPIITEITLGKSFRWLGALFIRGIFDGEHYFRLEVINKGQTRLIHGENFSGILSGILLKMIGTQTRAGFEKMNMALKEEVEVA